jgi:hypothetical protein
MYTERNTKKIGGERHSRKYNTCKDMDPEKVAGIILGMTRSYLMAGFKIVKLYK